MKRSACVFVSSLLSSPECQQHPASYIAAVADTHLCACPTATDMGMMSSLILLVLSCMSPALPPLHAASCMVPGLCQELHPHFSIWPHAFYSKQANSWPPCPSLPSCPFVYIYPSIQSKAYHRRPNQKKVLNLIDLSPGRGGNVISSN